ncbi:MAG: glycosyltransferase family 2 protein [Candidatus Eisenbacteria bacterium]
MSNKKPRVSVVIPNLNGKDLLGDCLRSLERQTFKDFEVVLVDNGSTDGSVAFVKDRFPWIARVIENPSNLGFAVACNQGIEGSAGELVALLNNDTEAHPAWLAELVRVADGNPGAGMFASKTLLFDRRDTIDTAGHLMYPDGLNRGRGRLEVDSGQYDAKIDVFFPSGAAALYRRKMFDDIGLFDQYHFAYGDDTDIGIRGRLAGWTCLFVPGAIVYHKYSMTTGEYSPQKVFLVERNRIWIAWKYFPMKRVLAVPFYSLVRYCYQAYGALSKKGAAGRFAERHSAWGLFAGVIRAYVSAFAGMPRICGERRKMMRLKTVTNAEIDRWFRDYRMSVKEIALKD